MNPLQKTILDIFKVVRTICHNNGIPFYAIGGTAIGAVRHGGFIPWDDDLDIAVPIEHFDRLIDTLRRELPPHLYVLTPGDYRHNHCLWIKVCNRDTTFIEKVEEAFPDAYKGVFVDIMPISGIPDEGAARERFYRRLKRLGTLNEMIRFSTTASGRNSFPVRLLSQCLRLFQPFRFFSDRYFSTLNTLPLGRSRWTGYVWSTGSVERLTFPAEWFSGVKELPFEDTTMACPADVDAYLRFQFGDYMQLPPEEKRLRHNGFVDLEKGFADYVEQKRKSL